MNTSITLAGVGGQGIMLVTRIFSIGLVQMGYDVKTSEVHGMAQRGGSVMSQIRYGSQVLSPIIGQGKSDMLVAFEEMEAARFLPYLKIGGKMIVNRTRIPPTPVLKGQMPYPGTISEKLGSQVDQILFVDAGEIACKLGSVRFQNMVVFGVMIKTIGLDQMDWPALMAGLIPAGFLPCNLQAFQAGLELVVKSIHFTGLEVGTTDIFGEQ